MASASTIAGRFGRRELLRFGLAGFGSMTLPGMLRARAVANASRRTSLILVWLRGGASHLETYDPKPDAPSDYRGPFGTIPTRTPGLNLGELLPRHAAVSDRFTIVRSMAHTGGGHPAGSLQLLSGDPDAQDKPGPKYPDLLSVSHYLRGARPGLPNYIGVNPISRYDSFVIAGPAFLGPAHSAFSVVGDPSAPQFAVPNIGVSDAGQLESLRERVQLRRSLDHVRKEWDASGAMDGMDAFEVQAVDMLTSPAARRAFDLDREPDAVRDRYGRNAWGQQCLLARRLVEAGVELISTTFDGPLCGRVQNWDDHAVNHHVFDALKFRAGPFDQAVSALIADVYDRGLDRDVLVVVTGEFGRTPRISHQPSSGGGVASAPAGVTQPGRDHWPAANSMLFAGGGIETGQVVGATDRRGETVTERRVAPGDFLATIYRHLGFDPATVTIPDFMGRPTPIVATGAPIPELASRAGRQS